jgi:hypothetical protein
MLSAIALSQFVLLASFATILVGCGNRYEAVPVKGKVTFNGGPMPAAGTVYFSPVEVSGDNPMRPAAADFGTDGEYRVSAFAGTDGMIPGTYDVHLHCWKVPPTVDGPRAVSHLPAKYGTAKTSDLKLTVEQGSSAKEFNIDIRGG